MQRRALPSVKTETDLSLRDLQKFAEGWLLSGEIAQHSAATLTNRRLYVRNLLWFLRRQEYECCDVMELRAFFAYITNGHKELGGRWGNPQQTKPVTSSTVATYHRHISAMFSWIVAEGRLEVSPMNRIPPPVDRPDDVQPFTDEQVNALLAAAKKSMFPRRDEAIVWFMLDTGVRASELSGLRFKDLDMTARSARIEGKGGKARSIFFGKTAAKALWQYLKEDGRVLDDPLFLSRSGEPLNRLSLLQLMGRLGKEAQITTARCSPHTFRHTFAVSFLRNGGNQMSLLRMLGHTDLKMTARYVKLAQADVERQHRQFSPADKLKARK